MTFSETIADLWNKFDLPGASDPAPAVSVLRLRGAIGTGGMGRGLSFAALEPVIKNAFARRRGLGGLARGGAFLHRLGTPAEREKEALEPRGH